MVSDSWSGTSAQGLVHHGFAENIIISQLTVKKIIEKNLPHVLASKSVIPATKLAIF
jgi:hypothetical protein